MSYAQGPGPTRGGPSTGGGGLGFRSRLREPPLHVMVEQYLAENSNRSYINIEDMIDSLQPLFFRYSRMKRQTFGGMVRRAYHEYCQGKRGGPRNETVESTTAEEVADGSGDEEEEEGDSDVEIQQESYLPQQDVTNTRLNSLYGVAPPAAKSVTSTSTSSTAAGGSPGTSSGGGITSSTNGANNRADQITSSVMALPADAFSNSTASTKIGGLTISLMKSKPNNDHLETWEDNDVENNDVGNDSDNDLEIIEEVPPTIAPTVGTGVIINSTSSGATGPVANARREIIQSTNSVNKNSNQQQIPCSSNSLNRGTSHASTIIAHQSHQSQRGTIRKSNFDPNLNNEMNPKKRMKKDVVVGGNSKLVPDSGLKLSDFAGSEKVVEEICRLLMHLKHPEVYSTLGVTAPRGFLLHGPPGTGKTLLANAIAGELQLPMLKVTGTEFISGISGESESNIRDLFNQAIGLAPCIIFIDEIDSITPKRENASKEMERRVVAQLLSCVDDLMNHSKGSQVLLIGATNRIEAIDTALRRAGRFDREICLGIPDEKSRAKILQVICKNLRVAPGFDMNELAKLTPGYVGADLQALVREAAVQAVNKALTGADKIPAAPEMSTINQSMSKVPSASTSSTSNQSEVDKSVTNSQADTQVTKMDEKADTTTCDSSSQQAMGEATAIAKEITQESDNSELTIKVVDAMEIDSVQSIPAANSTKTLENENAALQEESLKEQTPISSSPETKADNDPVKIPEQSFLRWIRDTAPLRQEELDELYIFMDDFEIALKHVQPSSKREGFATVPDTTWDDIGALKNIREELEVSILGPVKHSEAFEMLGLNTPAGVLLCGPPGCGKTLLAKAVANEAGVNFISVKGPELLNMYVGESERAVRQCFLRAKNSAPCVIFFDEIDALCPRRSDGPESGSGSRIVNQLLTEMDGMEGRAGVFIMAATNRPDIIDPAVLRPGRLDKVLFVDLPTAEDRYEILKAITKDGLKPCVDSDVDLKSIAYSQSCENFSGADLAALVREASIAAFKDLILMQKNACPTKDLKVSARHFEAALLKTKPSVSRKDRDKYAAMNELYSNTVSK